MFQLSRQFRYMSVAASFLVALLFPASLFALDANGFTVNAFGSTTPVGNLSHGFIEYYIPFTPANSGVYAVDNNGTVGTTSDSTPPNTTVSGGTLTMFLAFGPLTGPIGSGQLAFDFADLDLEGADDGGVFRETIQIRGATGSTPAIDNINDDTSAYTISGGSAFQKIEITDLSGIAPLSNQQYLYLELTFTSLNANGSNTAELLKAKLTYLPPVTISGRATLLGSNLPVADVSIVDQVLGSKLTNTNGEYLYTGVNQGTYQLQASKTGYIVVSNPNPLIVTNQNITNADFVLDCAPGYLRVGGACLPVFSIRGDVTLQGSGAPIAGVTITGDNGLGSTLSATDGTYSFTSLLNGTYTLTASAAGYVVVSNPNPVIINNADRNDADFVLACATGYSYRATTKQCVPDGTPIDIEASDGTFPDYVEVTWTAANCAANYVLYRAEKVTDVFASRLLTASPIPAAQGQLYLDRSAIPGVTYYYGVIALDSAGSECNRSDTDPGYRLSSEVDCDGDGISDAQEALDGTEVCDRGSNHPRLRSPAFAKWNTFLTQSNFLELAAVGSGTVVAQVTVFSINGEVLDKVTVTLTPGMQTDVDINAMAKVIDTYGIVRIDWNEEDEGAELGGRLSLYRPDPTGGTYSFAFARELINPVKGPQYGTGNSFDPQGQGYTVPNWGEIINVEKDPQTFTYNLYNQEGDLVQTEVVSMPGLSERDINAGHEFGEGVYLAEVIPHDAKKEFYFSVARYSSNHIGGDEAETYNFAMARRGQAGTGSRQYAPISNLLGACWSQTNWVEVVNVLQVGVTANLTFRRADGAQIDTIELPLDAHSQYHIPGSALLEKGATGSVEVKANTKNALLVQSLVYYHDCESNLTQSAYLSPGRIGGPKNQMGSYNRFLGMENLLTVLNGTEKAIDYVLKLRNGATSIGSFNEGVSASVAATHNLSNSEIYGTAPDTYGTVSLKASESGALTAEVVRLRTNPDNPGKIDFVFQTEVR